MEGALRIGGGQSLPRRFLRGYEPLVVQPAGLLPVETLQRPQEYRGGDGRRHPGQVDLRGCGDLREKPARDRQDGYSRLHELQGIIRSDDGLPPAARSADLSRREDRYPPQPDLQTRAGVRTEHSEVIS